MKKYFKFSPFLFFGFCLILNSCSQADLSVSAEENNNQDFIYQKSVTQQNSLIIQSFDAAIEAKLNDSTKTEEELSQIFLEYFESNDGELVTMESSQENIDNLIYSDDYFVVSDLINSTSLYSTHMDYLESLKNLSNNLESYDLDSHELTLVQSNIIFMQDFVIYLNNLTLQKSGFSAKSDCGGWWSCWGNCVAGTVSWGLIGGMSGCVTLGSAGVLIGGAVTLITGPGAAVGASAGGIAGTVIGAFHGASESCN